MFGFKKKKPSLIGDIKIASDWISRALISSGYNADFTINSFKEIDRFFDEQSQNGQPKPGGLLSESLGQRLFAIGCYIGSSLIKNYGGKWITDDNDPEGEINIIVEIEQSRCWPVQRVMKRYKNGKEDSIYAYGVSMKKE
jgi:hypothetical protein